MGGIAPPVCMILYDVHTDSWISLCMGFINLDTYYVCLAIIHVLRYSHGGILEGISVTFVRPGSPFCPSR